MPVLVAHSPCFEEQRLKHWRQWSREYSGIPATSPRCTGMVLLGIGGGEDLGRKPFRKIFQYPRERWWKQELDLLCQVLGSNKKTYSFTFLIPLDQCYRMENFRFISLNSTVRLLSVYFCIHCILFFFVSTAFLNPFQNYFHFNVHNQFYSWSNNLQASGPFKWAGFRAKIGLWWNEFFTRKGRALSF